MFSENKFNLQLPTTQCFVHIFHIHIEDLFNKLTDPYFVPDIFFQKSKVVSMKRQTNMADEGNEITLEITSNYIFTFAVEKSINQTNFKSFTHRCINAHTMFASFIIIWNFHWDSVNQVTIFEIIITITDTLFKNSVLSYFSNHYQKSFKNVEEHFRNKSMQQEQIETIIVDKNIAKCFGFFYNNVDNIHFLFGYNEQEVRITKVNNDILNIVDKVKNNNLILNIKFIQQDEMEKKIEINIIQSDIPVPKQQIQLGIVEVNKDKSIIYYKHIILQHIDSDIISSYKSIKQKVLYKLKHAIENTK